MIWFVLWKHAMLPKCLASWVRVFPGAPIHSWLQREGWLSPSLDLPARENESGAGVLYRGPGPAKLLSLAGEFVVRSLEQLWRVVKRYRTRTPGGKRKR